MTDKTMTPRADHLRALVDALLDSAKCAEADKVDSADVAALLTRGLAQAVQADDTMKIADKLSAALPSHHAVEAATDLTETLVSAIMKAHDASGLVDPAWVDARKCAEAVAEAVAPHLSAARAVSAPAAALGGVEGWRPPSEAPTEKGAPILLKFRISGGDTHIGEGQVTETGRLWVPYVSFDRDDPKVLGVIALSASPAAPAAQSGDGILWCAHVQGPDDVYPARDYDHAVEICNAHNAVSEKFNFGLKPDDINYVRCVAYPAIWPWSAASHAEGLASAPAPREA